MQAYYYCAWNRVISIHQFRHTVHTTAVTVYKKTKPTGDIAEYIDTKKNEVYMEGVCS